MTSRLGPIVFDETHVVPVADPTPATGPADPYRVLHYPGDLTADLPAGHLLGADAFGRPFEVLDVEVEHREANGHFDGDGCTFPAPGHLVARSTVHLQYATDATLRAANARLQELLAGLR